MKQLATNILIQLAGLSGMIIPVYSDFKANLLSNDFGPGTVSSFAWDTDYGLVMSMAEESNNKCDSITQFDPSGEIFWKKSYGCNTVEGNSIRMNYLLPSAGAITFVAGTEVGAINLTESLFANSTAVDFFPQAFVLALSSRTGRLLRALMIPADGALAVMDTVPPVVAVTFREGSDLYQSKIFPDDSRRALGSFQPQTVSFLSNVESVIGSVVLDISTEQVLVMATTTAESEGGVANSLIARSTQGVLDWKIKVTSSQPNTPVAGVRVNNNLFCVVGSTMGALQNQTHNGMSDVFLTCVRRDGNLAWQTQWGTSGDDLPQGISAYAPIIIVSSIENGQAYVRTFRTSDFSPSETFKLTDIAKLHHFITLPDNTTEKATAGYALGSTASEPSSVRLFSFTATLPPPQPTPEPSPAAPPSAFVQFITSTAAIIGGAILGSLIFCCGLISGIIWWLDKRIKANKAKSAALASGAMIQAPAPFNESDGLKVNSVPSSPNQDDAPGRI